jgi:Ca-activated chloride channel family protein
MGQLPLWLAVACAVLLGIAWVLLRLERHREGRLHRFVEAQLASRLLLGYDARVRRPLFWFSLLGCVFLALTFMQPRWGKTWVSVDRASRDVVVLLDTSESMNAQDPAPTRIERARQKIEQLMAKCPGDRFGLIAFSGDASLQCPLTLDHGYFRSVLASVDTDTMTEEGTDIAAALKAAVELFQAEGASVVEQRQYSRALVLLSDGEQVTGDAVDAASEAAGFATVHVVGIGDPQGADVTFPEWMTKYASVPNAKQPHRSVLDESTLSKVAVEGGGLYVRSTPSDQDVNALFAELEALHARATTSDLRYNMVNRYRWPLSVALACFLLEGAWLAALPHVRRWRMRRADTRRATGHA